MKNDGRFVGISCGKKFMPRFNSLRLASTEFTSRVGKSRWLNSGIYVYLSSRGCLVYELGNWQSPSRGDRANCDVMDLNYVAHGDPHVCGT